MRYVNDVSEKNKSLPILLMSLAEHLQILQRMWFIYNDNSTGDNNTYKEMTNGLCQGAFN